MMSLIDIDNLLKPITENEPTGIDPRSQDSEQRYQQVKEARLTARRLERETMLDTEANPEINVQWQQVANLSAELLSIQAKDIEVTVWLIEALTRLGGFTGLADGFTLLHRLIATYWPATYPIEDEEGLPSKLAALTGLNGITSPGALIDPIYWLSITQTPSSYNTWHYQQALKTSETVSAASEEQLSLATLEDAAKQSGPVFIQQIKTEIERCLSEYQTLCQLLDKLCGIEHAPPSSNIRNALQACLQAVTQIGKTMLAAIEQNSATPRAEFETDSPIRQSTNITSRQQAFADLLKLADYFRQHEPNSPVSYLLEQAVRWGNMPLPQLLAELINDQQSLQQSYQLIGVKAAASD